MNAADIIDHLKPEVQIQGSLSGESVRVSLRHGGVGDHVRV